MATPNFHSRTKINWILCEHYKKYSNFCLIHYATTYIPRNKAIWRLTDKGCAWSHNVDGWKVQILNYRLITKSMWKVITMQGWDMHIENPLSSYKIVVLCAWHATDK
jgi:hypothetical protein